MSEPASHYVPLDDGTVIHLKRFPGSGDGDVVLLLHGAIENGRIFYSRSGKGFAPWLASQGYDVWVMDLGGRGESAPPVRDGHPYSQTASITRELPAVVRHLKDHRPGAVQHWIAHSWGGVIMAACLARFPAYREGVRSLCFFGSKRRVRVWTWQRLLYVDLVWAWLSPLIVRLKGYLPARRLGFGSDDESRLTHAEGLHWVRTTRWVDPEDGFDYAAALRDVALPPTLFIAGAGDRALGHPDDVRRFMDEYGCGRKSLLLLSENDGNVRDYGHIDMLTAPEAVEDHFPRVRKWLADCRKRDRSEPEASVSCDP